MNFIFPQNYNFKSKLFGIFDYSTIFLNILWNFLVLFFIHFFNNLNLKIFLFFILSFPLFLFSLFGFNGESIFYVIKYLLNFLLKKKIILFQKNNFY